MYSSTLALRAAAELEIRKRKTRIPDNLWAQYSDPDPIHFILTHFYIPETNQPMEIYPSQEVPLREALSTEASGKFRYSTVVWSAVKKSAKSSIAAAVGLWFAWRRPWSSVKVVANDLKQADSRVAYYMRRAIQLHPQWKDSVQVVGTRILLPNRSTVEAIPIDPKGEAGANDDLVIYSELWGWKQDSAKRMWTETTLSPLKFGQSMRWCETYAGFSGESPILEDLYAQGVTNGECIDAEREMYRNGRLFVLWNTKPTLPWQTQDYYQQEASSLLPAEFERVHRNAWGSSTSRFIPSEWWKACEKPLPAYGKNEPWVIALDAAISGDCFGLVAVTRILDKTIVRHVRKWKAAPNEQIIYTALAGTDPMLSDTPEGEIYRLVNRHSVVEITYDPYQLHSLCHELAQKLVVYFKEFSQATPRLVADKMLRDDIREGTLWHGEEPDLTEHVLAANAVTEGDKLRIVKRAESMKIDLAVCLSMANHEAKRLNL